MVVETIVPSNASFVTIYTGHPWGRKTMFLGKMIATTRTRVVDKLKVGCNGAIALISTGHEP
jgi:hypothetical protein